MLKAPLAILVGKFIYELLAGTRIDNVKIIIIVLLADSAILGHIFPIHLKFKGGKGFATYLGALLTLSLFNVKILIIPVIGLVLAFITNYIVAATFTVILLTPLFLFFIEKEIISGFVLLFVSFVILMKHKENIIHIKDGTEMKIREAFKNKYKEK